MSRQLRASASHNDLLKVNAVGPRTPLRLNIAAALAYPDGSMTGSGLRREAKRGRLVIERTAGKDYTTLAAIERMRELCRVAPRDQDSGCDQLATMGKGGTPPSGSSRMPDTSRAQAALQQTLQELSARLSGTSTRSTPPRPKPAAVIPLPSRSWTF
jgi:hypothetical protein